MPPKPPVVGIGASAGGIRALQDFFSAIRDDLGLAFVVVVHLAPDHKSELPEILRRKTKMPVIQVGDHDSVKLEPNFVYVIAPDRKLQITDTSVGASRFEQPHGQRAAIDLFFRSLASSHGDGFAVVLSGSGSDGAVGAKAVKEAGGVVLVQDPTEAEHGSMPRAVIATGVADVIAPVEELARRLSVLVRNKDQLAAMLRAGNQGAAIDDQSESAFGKVLELLRKQTGHDFTRYKRNTVFRRLGRRMQLSQRTTISDYLDYLEGNVEEVQALFDDLLISVTTFFRDPEAWAALQEQVIGTLIEDVDADQSIRVWVPGCATGEEAYTLAILFQEEMQRRKIQSEFVIFASDVDEGALAAAREAVYPTAISADVSEDRLDRYFTLQDAHYRVSRDTRDRVVLAPHSLLRDPPFSRLHLISCRNLLIYLDRELQEQVMALFHYACRDDAYLFLGISEQADQGAFRTIDKKHRIFQVQKSDGQRPDVLPSLLATPGRLFRQEREPKAAARPPAAEIHLEALEEVAPPSLIVDENWNILHLSNSAASFLQQRGGPYARRIIDVVRPELRDEVHMVLHRAFEEPGPQSSPFAVVQFNGTARRIAVVAQRHIRGKERRLYVLLTFLVGGEAATQPASDTSESSDEMVHGLREKLRQAELRAETMRDDHYLVNEDLRAANEELQSLNEEYRSTTEELETSKEELQSVNEELQTVNHELESKLEEISKAHNDLENLMAATNVPTLFLSKDLRINRFTPQFAEIFNITSKDHGRPIGNFTHCLEYDGLEKDATTVLTTLAPVERDVRSRDGRTFGLRLAAYRIGDDKVDGVVVTLVDVTALLKAETDMRASAERFRALVDASAQIVWTMDAQGRVVEDSPSWRAFTGQTYEQWSNSWLDAVHPEDRPMAREAWQKALGAGTVFASEFRVFHVASETYRWTSVRAVPLRAGDAVRGWVGMHIDVTERREAENALRETDKRKDEFLAILGHELRNPLVAIRSSVAVHEADADGVDPVWTVVARQSRHMMRLVNDLLDIMRIDRGKLTLQQSTIDLLDCVRDVASAVEPICRSAGISLDVDLPSEPLYVYADSERLVQILDNLLRNAVSYTDRGGRIRVLGHRRGGDAVISVRDTGIGMEPDEIERLFEPYRQVDPGRRSGGLGLGLTLVRRLAELHGGAVIARSDGIGKGSEFAFRLPLMAGAEHSTEAAALPRPPRRRVLVVDDDTDVADMFAILLETLDQDVRVAYAGEAALQAAREHRPEVAFLDLSMPGMGGDELARRLREQAQPGPYIVALSGFGIDTRKASSNFDNHLLKPAAIEKIVEMLSSLGE